MSLHKTYRVQCEGVSLAARLGLLKSGPGVLFHGHVDFGPPSDETAKARRLAIKDGWTRVTKTLPLANIPSMTTDIKFDLCPSCTKTVGGRS